MLNSTGHTEDMVVNSTELKSHLGRYLRSVEQDSTTLEVRVRDRTVAYVIPAIPRDETRSNAGDFSVSALQKAGLRIDLASHPRREAAIPGPVTAGDGREDVVSVKEMRRHREW